MIRSFGTSAQEVSGRTAGGLPGAPFGGDIPRRRRGRAPPAAAPSRPRQPPAASTPLMILDFRPSRHVTALLLLLGAPACAGDGGAAVWGRGEAVRQLVQSEVQRADGGSRVDLRDLAPFRWETLYVLAPGTPADSVTAAIGASLPGAARLGGPQVSDSATLLVFTAGGDVIAAALLPHARVEVDAAATGRRYGPDSAGFRIQGLGEGRGRLLPE